MEPDIANAQQVQLADHRVITNTQLHAVLSQMRSDSLGRIESFRDRWKGKLYRSARKPTLFVELVLAAYMVASFLVIAWIGEWAALPYLGLFVAGYVYVFGLSVAHARR